MDSLAIISTHAPRTGSDISIRSTACGCDISTHAPRTGSDLPQQRSAFVRTDFNPRSPHGERRRYFRVFDSHVDFNPRSPHGERRHQQPHQPPEDGDFNPRSPHGERRCLSGCTAAAHPISTHAPRTGSDAVPFPPRHLPNVFQPTLPARGATFQPFPTISVPAFQPTLPARGATPVAHVADYHLRFQPTLPARGATRYQIKPGTARQFQPTLPARGATGILTRLMRAGRDFNPRSPHGERLSLESPDWTRYKISTHAPRTGSDRVAILLQPLLNISTHAPRTGSDGVHSQGRRPHRHFNPRSPHGERRRKTKRGMTLCYFNPRSPHGERPDMPLEFHADLSEFQPTLPARGATPDGSHQGRRNL